MYTQRTYSGASDLQAMAALAHDSAASNLHVADLPCRFSSWAVDHPENVGLSIYVETDNYRDEAFALYESIGFHVERDVLIYRKDYAEF